MFAAQLRAANHPSLIMYITKENEKRNEKKELRLFLGLGNSNRRAAMKRSSLDMHSIDKSNNVRKLRRKGMEQAL